MNDKKDNNGFDDKPFSESTELFETLFREGLEKESKEPEQVKAGAEVPVKAMPEKKAKSGILTAGKVNSASESSELFEELFQEGLEKDQKELEQVKAGAVQPKDVPEKREQAGVSNAVADKPVSVEQTAPGKGKALNVSPDSADAAKIDQPKKAEPKSGIKPGQQAVLKKKPSADIAQKGKPSAPLKPTQKKPALKKDTSKEKGKPPKAEPEKARIKKDNSLKKVEKTEKTVLDKKKTPGRDASAQIPFKEKTRKRFGSSMFILSGLLFLVIAGALVHYFGILDIVELTRGLKPEKESIVKNNISQRAPEIQRAEIPASPPLKRESVEPEKEMNTAMQAAPSGSENVPEQTEMPIAEKQISDIKESVSDQDLSKGIEPPVAMEILETEKGASTEDSEIRNTALSYPYSIYLGSFSKMEDVEKTTASYVEMGLEPYFVTIDLGEKGIWFRIFSGYFQTRSKAQKLIDEMNIKGAGTKSTRHANLIGVYASRDALEEKRKALIEMQYGPYIIKEGANDFFLYVGAFYQKARAEKQNKDLLSKGIQCRLVER